ncbi:hypothetical protein HC030_03260 [Planosporangium mesophilum]|uniref:hypothetical protein n=1 Tax=Planosporangium mesophilum TaxID=689768 RepID=UPI00143C3099|nr:hypothetical protein [Planosporangium mesophilum]NJC81584.1 hypothetical protein [Planosporangium mesophilum]
MAVYAAVLAMMIAGFLLGLALCVLMLVFARGYRVGAYAGVCSSSGLVLASAALVVAGILGRRAIDTSTLSVCSDRIRAARQGVIVAWLVVALTAAAVVAVAVTVRGSGGERAFALLLITVLALPAGFAYATGSTLRAAVRVVSS